jgi:glycosyltransferase involved in cell wall biosynthesis
MLESTVLTQPPTRSRRPQDPVRVLLVCSKYPPEYAGSGLRAHRTYQRLKRQMPIRLLVLCSSLSTDSWKTQRTMQEGVPVARIASPFKRHMHGPFKAFWYLLTGLDESLRTLWFLAREGAGVEVVHTFGHCFSGGVCAIWAGARGIPILRELVTMNSRPDDPPGLRWLVGWAMRRSATIVAISPLLAQRASHLGYSRVWCRPNPVDTTRFCINRAAKQALRRLHTPFAADDIVISDLSKYTPLKNKELLIRMMTHLEPGFKLLLAGPLEASQRPHFDHLCELARLLGVADRVHLKAGFVQAAQEYMQLSDVFAFPSLSDGLGTPVLEAICCGVPVVANRIGGVTDWWVEDGLTGALCEPTPETFAIGVKQAVNIPAASLDAAAEKLAHQAGADAIDERYCAWLLRASMKVPA